MSRSKRNSRNLAEQGFSDTQHLLSEETDERPEQVNADWKAGNRRRRVLVWSAFTTVLVLAVLWIMFGVTRRNKLLNRDAFGPTLIIAKNGAVATELIECSEVGVDILKAGGNAVDAAIASALCVGTINSFSAGIGGGGFMLIRTANGTYDSINFRETAPAASNVTMFVKDPLLARVGGLAVAVPGELRGLEMAHKRHGRLPWKRLFEPSINMSRDGFSVPPELAHRLQIPSLKQWIESTPTWSEIFAPNGVVLKEGELLKREKFAATLEAIAEHGADAFYSGPIAESIVSFVRANGGILTMEDMAAYHALRENPVEGYYHGHRVLTTGAPSSGPALIAMLNIIEGYVLKAHKKSPEEALDAHRVVEAMKCELGCGVISSLPKLSRKSLCLRLSLPPKLVLHGAQSSVTQHLQTNNSARIAEIMTKAFAAKARHNITDDRTHDVPYYNPKYETAQTHGTTHLSVVDSDDMSVTLTSTINLWFGSRLMDPTTGVILNDEMDDFSIPGVKNAFGLPPSPLNYAAPHKRPLSSSVPTIIEHNTNFEMALGASGGSFILTATLLTIIDILDKDRNLLQAIHGPRVHHQLMPNVASLESGYNSRLEWALRDRGHNVTILSSAMAYSEVQAVRRMSNGMIEAVSDFRKQGIAAGY